MMPWHSEIMMLGITTLSMTTVIMSIKCFYAQCHYYKGSSFYYYAEWFHAMCCYDESHHGECCSAQQSELALLIAKLVGANASNILKVVGF